MPRFVGTRFPLLNRPSQRYALLRWDNDEYMWGGTALRAVATFLTAIGGTYARTGTYYARANDGSFTSFASNVVRRVNRGLLLEPSRTNLCTNPSNFTNWVATNGVNVSSVDNKTDIFGGSTADQPATVTGNAQHFLGTPNFTTTSGSECVMTWHVRTDSTQAWLQMTPASALVSTIPYQNFNVTTGLLGSAGGSGVGTLGSGVQSGSGGYKAYYMSFIPTASATNNILLGWASGTADTRLSTWNPASAFLFIVSCFQVEQGVGRTSPIPTGSATRPADVLTIPLPSGLWHAHHTYDDGSVVDEYNLSGSWTLPTAVNLLHIVSSELYPML